MTIISDSLKTKIHDSYTSIRHYNSKDTTDDISEKFSGLNQDQENVIQDVLNKSTKLLKEDFTRTLKVVVKTDEVETDYEVKTHENGLARSFDVIEKETNSTIQNLQNKLEKAGLSRSVVAKVMYLSSQTLAVLTGPLMSKDFTNEERSSFYVNTKNRTPKLLVNIDIKNNNAIIRVSNLVNKIFPADDFTPDMNRLIYTFHTTIVYESATDMFTITSKEESSKLSQCIKKILSPITAIYNLFLRAINWMRSS